MYACQGSKNRMIAINPATGEVKVIAEGVKPNDLAVTKDGFILFTDTRRVAGDSDQSADRRGNSVDTGISKPNGIALSNDGGTLAVSDYGGTHTWTFRVAAGGVLDAKMPTMPMRLAIDPKGEFKFNEAPPNVASSLGDGMAVCKAAAITSPAISASKSSTPPAAPAEFCLARCNATASHRGHGWQGSIDVVRGERDGGLSEDVDGGGKRSVVVEELESASANPAPWNNSEAC